MSNHTQNVVVIFERMFVRGLLLGIHHIDQITHVDRQHAARWVRGIRANARKGVLDYRLTRLWVFD